MNKATNHLLNEMYKLVEFIQENYPDEVGKDDPETVIDTAIRLLKENAEDKDKDKEQ